MGADLDRALRPSPSALIIRFTSLASDSTPPPALGSAYSWWCLSRDWDTRAPCLRLDHDLVICSRQLFGD